MTRNLLARVALLVALSPAALFAAELGVYRWEAPAAPANVDAWEIWLGRPVQLAEAFEARDTWDNIDGAAWQLGPWSQWVRAKPGRNLVLAVPMLPETPVDTSLDKCAAGQYDPYWRNLANELAYYGLHWAYLRLGWEMDGTWYRWGAPKGSGREAAFAGCFRRIVQTMRAAQPANQWKFVWNPTATWTDPAWLTATWPGDAYVDVVGIDLYDQTWAPNTYPYPNPCDSACRLARQQTAWNTHAWYLQTMRNFALARGKQFAIPEWGLVARPDGHGGGDNPYYIQKMYEFISDPANAVQFHVLFDVRAPEADYHISGLDQPTLFPQGAAKFRQLFGPTTATTTPTAPSTTTTPSTTTATALPAPGTGTTEIWFKSPSNGATVSGVLQQGSCYVAGRGVSRVEFFLDATRLNTDSNVADGMSCVLDTTKFANGKHQLKAVAYGSTGAAYTEIVSINISNASTSTTTPTTSTTTTSPSTSTTTTAPTTSTTTTAPTTSTTTTTSTPLPTPMTGTLEVWFKSPLSGATVSGVLQGNTCYVAGRGVSRIEFFLDATLLNTDSNVADGMSCVLDTTKFANGKHQLKAVAYSSTGASYIDTTTINISNTTTTTTAPPPTTTTTTTTTTSSALPAPTAGTLEVWFKTPLSGATVSGVLQGDKCYVAGRGVSRVEFFLGSTRLNTDSNVGDGMSCVLDTTRFANNTYYLRAIAYDSSGRSYTEQVRITIRN